MAVLRLNENAYGMTIRQTVEEAAREFTSIGAIYTTLERLEKKGFVRSWQGESTPERGGKAKRYFAVEGSGIEALHDKEAVRQNLRHGAGALPGLVGGVS